MDNIQNIHKDIERVMNRKINCPPHIKFIKYWGAGGTLEQSDLIKLRLRGLSGADTFTAQSELCLHQKKKK